MFNTLRNYVSDISRNQSYDFTQDTLVLQNPAILDRKTWWFDLPEGKSITVYDNKELVPQQQICYSQKCMLKVNVTVESRSIKFLKIKVQDYNIENWSVSEKGQKFVDVHEGLLEDQKVAEKNNLDSKETWVPKYPIDASRQSEFIKANNDIEVNGLKFIGHNYNSSTIRLSFQNETLDVSLKMYRSYTSANQSEHYRLTHPKQPEGIEPFDARNYQNSGVYIFLPDMNIQESFDYTLLKDAYLFNDTCMMFNYEIPRAQIAELDDQFTQYFNGTEVSPNIGLDYNKTKVEDLSLRTVQVVVEVFKDNTLQI